jgi:hypothetical protein
MTGKAPRAVISTETDAPAGVAEDIRDAMQPINRRKIPLAR